MAISVGSVTVPLIARVNGTDVTVGGIEFALDAEPVVTTTPQGLRTAQGIVIRPAQDAPDSWAFRPGGK